MDECLGEDVEWKEGLGVPTPHACMTEPEKKLQPETEPGVDFYKGFRKTPGCQWYFVGSPWQCGIGARGAKRGQEAGSRQLF